MGAINGILMGGLCSSDYETAHQNLSGNDMWHIRILGQNVCVYLNPNEYPILITCTSVYNVYTCFASHRVFTLQPT